MKKSIAILALAVASLTAVAKDLTPILNDGPTTTEHLYNLAETPISDSVTNPINAFTDFLRSATTNIIIVPYGIASTDFKKFGGGVALGYELSQNVVPFLRVENYNGDFFMPSGTIQLQVPFHLGSFTLIPFAYTGVAVPLGNHSSDPVVGLIGTGGAIRLGAKFDFLAAYEIRSSVGNQICVGFGWKPNGW